MPFTWRRSTTLGPFRLTASKRGYSLSAGNRVYRQTVNSRGRRTTTWRLPGAGISWRKTRRG